MKSRYRHSFSVGNLERMGAGNASFYRCLYPFFSSMMSGKTLCQSLFFIIFIFNTAMFE